MKILVTGSEGSLMQAVIPLLLQQGHEIRGIDNFARHGEIERQRDYEFIRGDLTDGAFVEKITRGVDAVVQSAALLYGVGGFHRYPADILSKDVTLHQNVLWSMLKNNVERIVYISSSMVYERALTHPNKEEDSEQSLIPLTGYGMSKVVGERLTRAFFQQYGINYTIWRPFNIITPYEKGEAEIGTSHVFADYIKNIVIEKKRVIPIIGDGEQVRCFTWITDMARPIAEHSFSEKTLNDVFNLGNAEPVTMKDLARLIDRTAQRMNLIAETSEELQFETQFAFDSDVKIRIPDVSKAKNVLGWEATMKIADSVEECLKLINYANH